MWPHRVKGKAKLAAGVCFYAGCLHRIKVLPLKTGVRVEEKKAQRLRGSALHKPMYTNTQTHTWARANTNGKAMSCMTAQTVQSLTNAQDAASIFCSIIPSLLLSFFYHMVYPPTRTHRYTPTHTNTLMVPPVSCLYFSLCPPIFISLNLFFTLLLGVCAGICHHCSV